jgi:hypothetical protein
VIPAAWPYSPDTYHTFAALKKAGFTIYCCGDRHAPHVLVATYDWRNGYINVINIRGADRVTAARLPKYDGLDIFAPTKPCGTTWALFNPLWPRFCDCHLLTTGTHPPPLIQRR